VTGLSDPRVAIVELAEAKYEDGRSRALSTALQSLADLLDWDTGGASVFGGVIPAGAHVLVKPNWVSHANQGPWGLDPLITNSALIRDTVQALLQTKAAEILVGDAPLQLCDFERLVHDSCVRQWAEALAANEPRFMGVQDFRRTTCEVQDGRRIASEDRLPEGAFVLHDLGNSSLLEPITDSRGAFRVTQYNPTHMVRTHSPGRHQYLIARVILDADVVVNLPKLKTHKKAGITCALKNLIGINGNKEYLPHHRVGGAEAGGDCYPGRSRTKRAYEYALDRMNLAHSSLAQSFWRDAGWVLDRISRLAGDRLGVEGSWSGNDTIWRTCLDLNRILLYGLADGSMADGPQRNVIHVVDAVVAGHGDGPLAPEPLPLRLLLAGRNAAAIDWVGALLLGYDPDRIPIVREAFADFRWPVAPFSPADIQVVGDLGAGSAAEVLASYRPPRVLNYPIGWRDAVAGAGP
jgi:uncharacterized protein (DUF362 family)